MFGEGPTQGLDDTTLTGEATYPISFKQSNRRFVLSLHYNGDTNFLFVDAIKIFQFKAKNSGIKKYVSCLSNVSKDFTIDNMKKRNRIKRKRKFFSVDYRSINTNEILDIHIYLTKELL